MRSSPRNISIKSLYWAPLFQNHKSEAAPCTQNLFDLHDCSIRLFHRAPPRKERRLPLVLFSERRSAAAADDAFSQGGTFFSYSLQQARRRDEAHNVNVSNA
jgi:hypothetical protein